MSKRLYLIRTDISVFATEHRKATELPKYANDTDQRVCISAMTLCDLLIYRSTKKQRTLKILTSIRIRTIC